MNRELLPEIRTALDQSIMSPKDIDAITKRLVRLNGECSRERAAIETALVQFERGIETAAKSATPQSAAMALDRSNAAIALHAEFSAVRRIARELFAAHKVRLRATVAKRVKAGTTSGSSLA